MDRLDVLRSIATKAHQGDMAFPVSVRASFKIKQAIDDPDCALDMLVRLIGSEPLLSVRLVALANAAVYRRTGVEATTVRTAVMRLGFRPAQNALTAVMVRQFSSAVTHPMLRAASDRLWRHTVYVAALAHIIARRSGTVDPETAMFAGLVHEIGGFYLLACAEGFPGLLDLHAADWEDYGVTLIARGVMQALAVPECVREAVDCIWHGMGALPPASLGDVLALADHLAPISSPLTGRSRAMANGSNDALGFVIGLDAENSILEASAQEVHSLVAALLH